MIAGRYTAAVVLSLLFPLSGCGDNAGYGYADVRASTRSLEKIALGSTRLDFRKGPVLLVEPAGDISLREQGFFGSTYCTLKIRPSRITRVDLYIDDGAPRCQCQVPDFNDGSICT
jgi:hypothetical protein